MNDKRNPHTRGPARGDPAFDRRVAFLAQSFTGIDWETRPTLGPEDIQRYVEKGRDLRSQALASLLRRGATSSAHVIHRGLRAAIDAGRSLVKAIVRAHERHATIRELMALDDRTLKDIGVRRDEIYSVVEELGKDHPLAPVGTTRPASQIVSTQSASADAANDDDFESAA